MSKGQMLGVKWESSKVFVLGLLLYLVSARAFFALGQKWFDHLCSEHWIESVAKQRQTFWKSFCMVIIFVFLVIAAQYSIFNIRLMGKHWLQVAAAVMALTASLGRGGWQIQTVGGRTMPERIDRGMYVISELGATGILLFILTF